MKKLNKIIKIKVMLLLLVAVSVTSCKKAIDPGDWDILVEQPAPIDPDPVPDDGKYITLKVMSYNAKTTNVETLKQYIKDYSPDLILLRQIDSATNRMSKLDVPKEVAVAAGMNHHFGKGFDYQTGGYGNAVLSRFPILETKTIVLTGGAEVRSYAGIKVKIDDFNEIYFGGTELDVWAADESGKISQLTSILSYTRDLTLPVIFVGNFNFNKAGEGYNNITTTQTYSYILDQFTFGCITSGCVFNVPAAAPTGIFDFVTYKSPENSITVSNYTTGPNATSNFLPVIAELKLKLKED